MCMHTSYVYVYRTHTHTHTHTHVSRTMRGEGFPQLQTQRVRSLCFTATVLGQHNIEKEKCIDPDLKDRFSFPVEARPFLAQTHRQKKSKKPHSLLSFIQ